MILYGDYHTHTRYSKHHHGKGTMEENVRTAVQKGLKELAITDHGFQHGFYAVDRKKLPEMRAEIERLQAIYPIKLYLGLECNLISLDGSIDLTKEEEQLLDIVLVGYHKTSHPKSLKDFFLFFLPNHIYNLTGWISKKQIRRNTLAYINMIEKNNIDVVTHINYAIKADPVEIAKAAKKRHVMIELNGKRTDFTPEQVAKMIELKTKFIINSDAHRPEHIGECKIPMNVAILNMIPEDLIANVNKTASIKQHRK